MNIGRIITERRKAIGLTQQALAEKLNISFQAVSKWENGTSYPDITLLPALAAVLDVSVDSLLGYSSRTLTDYDKRYHAQGYYWGLEPNHLCYEIMRIKPPIKPYRVLDILYPCCAERSHGGYTLCIKWDVQQANVCMLEIIRLMLWGQNAPEWMSSG